MKLMTLKAVYEPWNNLINFSYKFEILNKFWIFFFTNNIRNKQD